MYILHEQIELQAKLLNYFLGSNKSHINHMRGTLWKSERCISEWVCQRGCKHVCTRIQTHPYMYQQ